MSALSPTLLDLSQVQHCWWSPRNIFSTFYSASPLSNPFHFMHTPFLKTFLAHNLERVPYYCLVTAN